MSLGKNTSLNLVGNIIPLIVGAVTIPILISKLGVEKFGILTILWTVIGYFSLFDFGVGRAITQQVALCLAGNKKSEVPAIIKAGLQFNIATGAAGMIILGVLSYYLSYEVLNVSKDFQQDVFYALFAASIGIPFATVGAGQRGALEGYEQFKVSNIAKIFLGISLFLFPLLSYYIHGPSLAYIAYWLVFARVLNCLILCWLLRNLPCDRIFVSKIDKKNRNKLFTFGLWMSVTNLVSPLLVNADRFFISSVLGASVVAFYTVPMEFLVRVLVVPNALGSSLLPALAKTKDTHESNLIFLRSIKFVAASMFAICCVAAICAYPLMKVFISEDFANKSWLICVVLSFGVFVNGIAYVPYTALHASGNAKATGILHAAEFALYIPILYLMIVNYGIIGAAISWTGRVIVDAICLFIFYKRIK